MGRPAAIRLHAALSLLGLALYVIFVIPRWWVLTGDIPATAATVGRIAAGLPIALGAVPVWLVLRGSLDSGVPELALRLRAWSGMLHVTAGVLIVLTAVAEIWFGLGAAGPWLFAVYGAAGAMAVLGVLAFYLSFVAEKPPAEPKPAKAEEPGKPEKPKKQKWRGRGAKTPDETSPAEEETSPAEESVGESEAETESPTESSDPGPEPNAGPDTDTESAATDDNADGSEATEAGTLRNKRPTGKRRHRLRRSAD